MKKKTLYMIGNSHIDPVWFWDWDEGMQEVKATFSSALDRLREDADVKFTSTSAAFFEWIEAVAPEMFQEIRARVREGRWELTGGWFLEPDCILPCGEALVRQGLYGQRYFQEKFGVTCRTASNVDSFGHTSMLPQILQKSGMREYVFMRPRLDTPLFFWESADGSRVSAISLPSEYTTWFYEPTRDAIEMAGNAADRIGVSGMACCYGVGNHGGGPTKENISSIRQLREEMPELSLPFGTYREFFDSLTEEEKEALPVRRDFFGRVNTGCYSMDGRLKKMNRKTEGRLLTADAMRSMAHLFQKDSVPAQDAETMRSLWKTLLFCQFHDTLGGTTIKPARDEAIFQLSGVCAQAKKLWILSMQSVMRRLDTRGEGFPLLLFNPTGKDYDGPVATELNWFCKDGLILKDPDGQEIPYQRVHTMAKARNYNIGGRRGIVFDAHVPALGFSIYRTLVGKPTPGTESALCQDSRLTSDGTNPNLPGNGAILENAYLKAVFDANGFLCSLYEKQTGYEALRGPVRFPIWKDERDSWGSIQGRAFAPLGEFLQPVSLETVENGSLRKVIRVTYRLGGSVLKQEYILYHNARAIEIKNRLFWDREWQMLKMELPLAVARPRAFREAAYETVCTEPVDGQEYSMHRFVDITQDGIQGLYLANDGKYAFSLEEASMEGTSTEGAPGEGAATGAPATKRAAAEGACLCVPMARSAIYAQGNGKDWYNPLEGYEYTDMGKQEFVFLLRPHGDALSPAERYRLAETAAAPLLVTTDCCHDGALSLSMWRGIQIPEKNVELGCIKAAEEGNGLILRLFETEGRETEGIISLNDHDLRYRIKPYEILTLFVSENGTAMPVNLLEEPCGEAQRSPI